MKTIKAYIINDDLEKLHLHWNRWTSVQSAKLAIRGELSKPKYRGSNVCGFCEENIETNTEIDQNLWRLRAKNWMKEPNSFPKHCNWEKIG